MEGFLATIERKTDEDQRVFYLNACEVAGEGSRDEYGDGSEGGPN